MDIEAEVAEAALRLIIQAEEWADFNSQSSLNSLAYDGLVIQIVTNVVDNAGAALTATGVTIPAFDKMIKRIRNQGGNKLDGIYLSFGLQTVVNQIVSPQTHYYLNIDNAAANLTAGDHVVSYQSPIGPVPVIGDFFCNAALPYPATAQAGSSGAQGLAFSDVFFLRHDNQGVEMADLVPIGRTELAKIADTVRFYINEYTVLAAKAEPWLALLTGVSDPTT